MPSRESNSSEVLNVEKSHQIEALDHKSVSESIKSISGTGSIENIQSPNSKKESNDSFNDVLLNEKSRSSAYSVSKHEVAQEEIQDIPHDHSPVQALNDIHSELQHMENSITQSTLLFDDVQSKRLLVKTLEDKLADSISKQVKYKKELEHLTTMLQFGSTHPNNDTEIKEESKVESEKIIEPKMPSEDISLLLKSQVDVLKQERRILQDTLLSTYLSQIRRALYSWMVKYHAVERQLSDQEDEIKQLKDQLSLKTEENSIITNLLAERHAESIERENKTIQELESIALATMQKQNKDLLLQIDELKHDRDKQLQLTSNVQIHFEMMQNDLRAHLEQMTLRADQWKCQYETLERSYEQLKVLYQEMYSMNTKHRETMVEKTNKWKECYKSLQKSFKNLQRKLDFYITTIPSSIIQEKDALWEKLVDQEDNFDYEHECQFTSDNGIDMLDLSAVLSYIATNRKSPNVNEMPGPT